MAQEAKVADFTRLLSSYTSFITYHPLRSEVPFTDFVTLPYEARIYEIPARASLDSNTIAKEVVDFVRGDALVIFIPGRQFDAAGTRHGQGGGWYDRFLAEVPREWLRIGFCFTHQFSPTPLTRESWDQAMDYVVVVDRDTRETTVYSSEGIL